MSGMIIDANYNGWKSSGAAAPTLTATAQSGPWRATSKTFAGTNLTGCTGVTINGVACTGISSTSTSVTVTTPAFSANGGPYNVVATTPSGNSGSTGNGIYTVIADATDFAVTASNKSVIDFGGGSSVVLTGHGFSIPASVAVTFGATAAASFVINSDTQITAVAPPKTASATPVDIVVSGGGASSTLAAAIEFFDTGNISGLKIDLQADRGVTQVSGKVTAIADNSGNSHNAAGVNGGSGFKPAFVSSGINGRPSWQGTSQAEYFTIAGIGSSFLSSVHAFLVQQGNGDTEPPAAVGQESWYMGLGAAGFCDFTDGNIYDNFGSSGRPGSTGGAAGHANLTLAHVLEVSYPAPSPTTTTRLVKVNGTTVITEAGCTPGWDPSNAYLMHTLGSGYRGLQSALIVYDHQFTSGERTRFAAWVLDKWGVTI